MLRILSESPSAAAEALAEKLLADGVPVQRDGHEWLKLDMPMIYEIVAPVCLCPRFLSLGDPFQHLLSSFAAMFPATGTSQYPGYLTPSGRLPEESGPSAFASQVVSEGRCVIMAGNVLASFETSGLPQDGGVLALNMIAATGSSFHALAPGSVRWGFLHQAVSAISGYIQGRHRVIMLHPCAPRAVCEAISAEAREFEDRPLYADGEVPMGVLGGNPSEWLGDAAMFVDEHRMATGYRDRSVRRLLVPAMAAWHLMVDKEVPDRLAKARAALASVSDAAWRRSMLRFVDMQPE